MMIIPNSKPMTTSIKNPTTVPIMAILLCEVPDVRGGGSAAINFNNFIFINRIKFQYGMHE
jgi:hypothetical protein